MDDPTSALKNDSFRQLIVLVIPGATAIGPYILVSSNYVKSVAKFWDDHPSAFVAIMVVVILTAGLVLEAIGSRIECFWDNCLGDDHKQNWDNYLGLNLKDDIIGQRYLRSVLLRMKFELSMGPALLIHWLGLFWINIIHSTWKWYFGFALISMIVLSLAIFLIFESYTSAGLLSSTRNIILKAINNKSLNVISVPKDA